MATRRADPIVDVTPMIDVVFQLVLFFMVSTTFIDSPGIQVELPKSSSDVVVADQNDVSVWMTIDGKVFVRDRLVAPDRLDSVFGTIAIQDPNTLVKIQADVGVTHGAVVALMDQARNAGLNRLAICDQIRLPYKTKISEFAPEGKTDLSVCFFLEMIGFRRSNSVLFFTCFCALEIVRISVILKALSSFHRESYRVFFQPSYLGI